LSSNSCARSRIQDRPVSCPTGRAPDRHSLMPLYFAGLWLAVNMAPGSPSHPDAKYSWSVEPSPVCTTAAPAALAPAAKAAASAGDDSRMSCAMTIRPASSPESRNSSTNADPSARATGSFSWSGTVPRTSYALTKRDRSDNAGSSATMCC
jgi:hypothetical protein